MTYGYGFWRSGYTTLIPWHWCWPSEPDPFDYLRGRFSGCGQRVDDDGDVIPAVYWECFREGYDDARYLYTLQQAIVQRGHSQDPRCLRAVEEGRKLLHETWNAIHVQQRYLADGMWPSEEFDTIRWLLAAQIQRLLSYPASGQAIAPSVLPRVAAVSKVKPKTSSPDETDAYSGGVELLDLGNGFADWKNGTAEGKVEIIDAAGHDGKIGLRWTVTMDHNKDGGEGGNYPVGWPRLARNFKSGELDLTSYDMLELWLRLDSNRNEVSDDRTPIGMILSSHNKKSALYETTIDLGDSQRVWIPFRFPLQKTMSGSDAGLDPWKSISRIQLYVSEHNYTHGTRLTLDVGGVSAVRFKTPMIAKMDAPHHFLLPRKTLAFTFDVFGAGAYAKDSHIVVASLEDAGKARYVEFRQNLEEPFSMAMPLPTINPNTYMLRLTILDSTGKTCSDFTKTITAHAGPLY